LAFENKWPLNKIFAGYEQNQMSDGTWLRPGTIAFQMRGFDKPVDPAALVTRIKELVG